MKLPQNNESNYTYVDGLMVAGFAVGMLMGELAICRGLIFAFCSSAVYSQGYYHASMIVDMHQTGCTYGIYLVSGNTPMDVLQYDAEHVASPAWAVTVDDLHDPSNLLYGHVRWWGIESGVGVDHIFNVSGGAHSSNAEIGPLSAAPTTVDYLVGTASGALSAEIAVGTTPGGELGGTWASPTVDAVHSGSAHIALGTTSTTAAAGDHSHGSGGHLLITDTPAGSPLVFPDILQNDAGTDLLYADA